ncbi:P-loop containing nucleoside triphosphate hydrolases superfamily protein [Actinidia rufa]|uniref:P-loop containing nucleoside triphosphate hydrolases superfamily protein n=1 Tax=Actinidia rufa TaxID=165716 RepID=A0A7J0FDB6_9ERIC|nr:P-loop containing nucleoside triphosphate hydrolases superfamily protein [Actinidia rufa]
MISVLANSYDSQAKLLNGTHKSHVHSPHEAKILANYKPKVNATLLVSNLKEADETTAKALEYFKSTRHIVLYYEDIVGNRTVRFEHETIYFLTIFPYSIPSRDLRNFLQKLADVQEFLRLPYRYLTSHQVKIHSGHLSKQIENWDDVQKALEGTSYGSFLHEDYQ